jgi:ABC-2 type transport system permease protein
VLLKQLAFLKRDFIIESSYRLGFLMDLSSNLLPILSFYFIGRMLAGTQTEALRPYGDDYFSFALVGLGLTRYFDKALQVFSTSLRRAQMSGVLEAALSTRTSAMAVILYDATYSFLIAFGHLVLVFAVGVGLGARFAPNWASVLLLAAVATASFVGLGILSGACVVLLKKGDPIRVVFAAGGMLLSGAMYPVSVLPEWLQVPAKCLPMTHAIHGLRLSLFDGASVAALESPLVYLGAFAAVLVPGSLIAFDMVVRKSRREGTLLHY